MIAISWRGWSVVGSPALAGGWVKSSEWIKDVMEAVRGRLRKGSTGSVCTVLDTKDRA